MAKDIFRPIEVTDPLTGKKKILTPEEQEAMLEKGIILPVSKPEPPTKMSTNDTDILKDEGANE